MIKFDTRIRVERPIDEVFSYVSDVGNLPQWNSAVQSTRRTSRGDVDGIGATYSMLRTLPTGQARNDLEVVAHDRPSEFVIRTTSGPTPFVYRYRLSPHADATILHLEGEAELGGTAGFLAPLVRRAVQSGVDRNLSTLKTILETTRLEGANRGNY